MKGFRSNPLIIAAVVFGCTRSPIPQGAASRGESGDAAVYAALVDSLYSRPLSDSLFVTDSTLSFHVPSTVGRPGELDPHASASARRVDSIRREHWRRFDSVPRPLMLQLERVTARRESSSILALPRPVHALSHAELHTLFRDGPSAGWSTFARTYPRARGYSTFSRIAYGVDSTDALVYYEYHCGPLCGVGQAVYLTRRADQRWRVREVLQFWVS